MSKKHFHRASVFRDPEDTARAYKGLQGNRSTCCTDPGLQRAPKAAISIWRHGPCWRSGPAQPSHEGLVGTEEQVSDNPWA